jgi:hypothetical protein
MKVNRCFEGTCRHHFEGRRLEKARSHREAGGKPSSGDFLLGLFFNPEHSGNMFLQNISCLSTDYTAFCPRRWNSSIASLEYRTPKQRKMADNMQNNSHI